jgi:hypothetical protein
MSSTKITKKAIETLTKKAIETLIKKETQPLIDEITELRAQLMAIVAGLIAEAPKEENTVKKETQPLIDEITELRAQLKAVVAGLIAEAPKEENTVKTKKVKAVKDALLPPPTTAPERLMTVPEEKREKKKIKRTPTSWALALQEVYMPMIKKTLGEENLPKGIWHMTVAAYLKKEGKTAPTEDDVKKAISFLESNQEYKSASAEKMSEKKSDSESGSVSDSSAASASKEAKKRGRPKKVKVEEKVVAANPFDDM